MHIPIRDYLRQLGQEYAGNPLGFLWEFAPIHEWWHVERMDGTQPIGFLTFHHLVLESFGGTFPEGRVTVDARSPAPYPAVLRAAARAVDDVGALREFSEDIERWHNGVHNAIGGAFVQARRNVYLRSFWQFHSFIDREFVAALGALRVPFADFFQEIAEEDQAWI
jgi:hypothetical protein